MMSDQVVLTAPTPSSSADLERPVPLRAQNQETPPGSLPRALGLHTDWHRTKWCTWKNHVLLATAFLFQDQFNELVLHFPFTAFGDSL